MTDQSELESTNHCCNSDAEDGGQLFSEKSPKWQKMRDEENGASLETEEEDDTTVQHDATKVNDSSSVTSNAPPPTVATETNFVATDVLTVLHELIANVTGDGVSDASELSSSNNDSSAAYNCNTSLTATNDDGDGSAAAAPATTTNVSYATKTCFSAVVTSSSSYACPNVTILSPAPSNPSTTVTPNQKIAVAEKQQQQQPANHNSIHPASSAMENIGSKLLLLAAQSASKSMAAASTDHVTSGHPNNALANLSNPPATVASSSSSHQNKTSSVSTPRLLLPKPPVHQQQHRVTTTTGATIVNENLHKYSSTGVSTTAVVFPPPNVQVRQTHLVRQQQQQQPAVFVNNATAPPRATTEKQTNQAHAEQQHHSNRLEKLLNRTSLSPYTFEQPPASAKLHIPPNGFQCLECGDKYAMKTCLEFHMQRRSVMIETLCVPCKQMFLFFNKCAYFAHIRHHRAKKWPSNVFRSVNVKPITWKLMEQWFDDTALKRFSDQQAFFDYEFGGNASSSASTATSCGGDAATVARATPGGEYDVTAHKAYDIYTCRPYEVTGGDVTTVNGGLVVSAAIPAKSKCTECAQECTDALSLKRHFMYNLPANQKQFICTNCQAVYFSQCSFQAHRRTHGQASPFVCPECGEVFQMAQLLATHLLSHRCRPTVLDSWRCVKCSTFYSSWEALVIHMAAAHCEMHHCCRSCTMAFASAAAFEEHKRSAHKLTPPESIEYRMLAKCCSCESLGFQGKDALIEHLKQHFANVSPFKVYRCAMCGRLMENKNGLVSHFKNVHRINVLPSNIEEDRIIIPPTPALTHSKTGDASHGNSVNPTAAAGQQPPPPSVSCQIVQQTDRAAATAGVPNPNDGFKYFSCKLCRNLNFRSELGLKLHMKMKHADRLSAAESAELLAVTSAAATANSTSAINTATATTTTSATATPAPIPLLSCYLCKQNFNNLDSRIDDGLQHLKNGQVVCLLCQNLPMNSMAMLIRHFSKHIDEQQRSGKLRHGVVFMCNRHCKEEFTDRAKALNHLRSLHGQRPLVCDKCRSEFVNDIDFRQHACGRQQRSDDVITIVDETERVSKENSVGARNNNHVTPTSAAATPSGNGASGVVAPSPTAAAAIKRAAADVASGGGPAKKFCPPSSYRCSKCETAFAVRADMHWHVVNKHKDKKFYTCLECATNFASPPSLGRHLITSHQINDVDRYLTQFPMSQPQKVNDFECDLCHQVFTGKTSLDAHVRTHGLLFLKTQEKRAD